MNIVLVISNRIDTMSARYSGVVAVKYIKFTIKNINNKGIMNIVFSNNWKFTIWLDYITIINFINFYYVSSESFFAVALCPLEIANADNCCIINIEKDP